MPTPELARLSIADLKPTYLFSGICIWTFVVTGFISPMVAFGAAGDTGTMVKPQVPKPVKLETPRRNSFGGVG